MKKMSFLFLVLLSSLSVADNYDDFIWSVSGGKSTTPQDLQDENGGYVIRDKNGNESWIDNIKKPKCSFTNVKVDVENGDDLAFVDDKINGESYIGSLDLSNCDIDE